MTPPQPTARRNAAIRRKRERGWKLREIAEHYGISRQRVHQIVNGAK